MALESSSRLAFQAKTGLHVNHPMRQPGAIVSIILVGHTLTVEDAANVPSKKNPVR